MGTDCRRRRRSGKGCPARGQASGIGRDAQGASQDGAPAMSANALPSRPVGLSPARSLPGETCRNGGPFFPCTTSFRQALAAGRAGNEGASLVSGSRTPARATQKARPFRRFFHYAQYASARMASLSTFPGAERGRCMGKLAGTAGTSSMTGMCAGSQKRGWQPERQDPETTACQSKPSRRRPHLHAGRHNVKCFFALPFDGNCMHYPLGMKEDAKEHD